MTNKISDYFNALQDKEILGIHFIENYFEFVFDKGYMRILSDASIHFEGKNFDLPSKDGNWELVKLINHKVTSVDENGNEIVIYIDNGCRISVNTKINASGENFQMRVDKLVPIFI